MCIPGIIPTRNDSGQISLDLQQHCKSAQMRIELSIHPGAGATVPVSRLLLDQLGTNGTGKDSEQTTCPQSPLQQLLPQFPDSQEVWKEALAGLG